LVFYIEFKTIYCICHYHRRLHQRPKTISILQRVAKYLMPMPHSPTYYSVSIFLVEFFFGALFSSVRLSVFNFFTDRISDKKRNYRRSKCRQIVFVGDFYRWSVFFTPTKQTLQDFIVLPTKLFRRFVIHSSLVILLPMKSRWKPFVGFPFVSNTSFHRYISR
jgi:hypothetical protein